MITHAAAGLQCQRCCKDKSVHTNIANFSADLLIHTLPRQCTAAILLVLFDFPCFIAEHMQIGMRLVHSQRTKKARLQQTIDIRGDAAPERG